MSGNKKAIALSILVLMILPCVPQARAMDSNDPQSKQWEETSIIWTSGEVEDVCVFHQFGTLTTTKGTILAFAEGRIGYDDAECPHHICMKRSLDGGISWGENMIVADAQTDLCTENENETKGISGHCYANPTAVVDKSSGRVNLLYAENYDNEYSRIYQIYSDDDGMTWSSPVELMNLFGDDLLARPFHLPGPGHGIQMQSGRIVITVWHRLSIKLEPELREYGLSVLYSDDHGETWTNRFLESGDHLNEGRITEVSPGKLKINARGIDQQRYQADSVDGGNMVWCTSIL